jgi:hypothetical protein
MRARFVVTFLISVAAAGCTQDLAGPGPAQIEGAITTFLGAPAAGCSAVSAKTVLIDPTHDGGTWWFPQGKDGFHSDQPHQGKAFADYLRGKGFTVTELGRGQTISPDSMMRYAVIVRAGYYADAQRPGYSTADLDAYSAYVGCARTLVMLAEFLRDGRTDDLAERLKIPLVGQLTGTITTFTPHALTAGVTEIPYIAGSYLANESNSSIQVLGRVGSQAVMGLLQGPGKVFFIGDVNGIQTMPQPFIDNLLAWGF